MSLSQRQTDALGHIADYCRKANEIATRYPTADSFLAAGWEVQAALIRCVEVIGEASNRLGPQYHGEHPEVPWKQIIGTRNRLIHGYDQVDLPLTWTTATQRVPVLLAAVEAWLAASVPAAYLPPEEPPAQTPPKL